LLTIGNISIDEYYVLLAAAAALAIFAVLFCLLFPRLWSKLIGHKKSSDESQSVFVEIGRQSTVKDQDTTHEPTATFYFSVNHPPHVVVGGVQVSIDNARWSTVKSPWTTETLSIGEHVAKFRAMGPKNEQLGVVTSVDWTVLPSISDSDKTFKQPDTDNANDKFVKILQPTLEHVRPQIKDVRVLVEHTPSEIEHLIPSSLEPLNPLHIQLSTNPSNQQYSLSEKDPEPVPELNGPFTEKQLIDLTPKQLKQALFQNPGNQLTRDQIKSMHPDDIRELLRTVTPVFPSVCSEKKDGSQ